ncbi:hypothetical protein WN55_03209 [Dufourea novaeangliae]|uniref:Uncharacterized protein n=1 Tax=Dufourea novaeangliae TaxID=178035 RepID=A0A154PLG9_DUFNO|nr:hypothetical protein WN55_03209 [Dufourea novaeangliae]
MHGESQVEVPPTIRSRFLNRCARAFPSPVGAFLPHMSSPLRLYVSDSTAEVLFLLNNLDDPRRIIIVPRGRGYVQIPDGKCCSRRRRIPLPDVILVNVGCHCARGVKGVACNRGMESL